MWVPIVMGAADVVVCDRFTGCVGSRVAITPYRQPRDIEYRNEPIPGAPPRHYRTVAHDPESPDYVPADAPARGLVPDTRLGTR